MGNQIPLPVSVAPVPAGDDETVCWGVGKAFGNLPTPSQLILRVSGVIKSDLWQASDGDPQNGEYLLQQDPGFSGQFEVDEGGLSAAVIFFAGFTFIVALSTTRIAFFDYFDVQECASFVNNGIENPFKGGSARIWIPKVQI